MAFWEAGETPPPSGDFHREGAAEIIVMSVTASPRAM